MTMARRPRNHSPAFKAKVSEAAFKGDMRLIELAQDFDVHPNQIEKWRDQLCEGATWMMPVETVTSKKEPALEEGAAPDADMAVALTAARLRGRLRVADLLAADDMLSAEELARELGMSRMTVNMKCRTGQLLGLEGANRGFRFPIWQIEC